MRANDEPKAPADTRDAIVSLENLPLRHGVLSMDQP
jgi:hypothetical protein